MRNTLIILILVFGGCSSKDHKFVLIDSELNDSRREYERKNRMTLDCIRLGVKDSSEAINGLADLYKRLDRIFTVKDSLEEIISPKLNDNDIIDLFEKLKTTVIDLHRPDYPTKDIEIYFEKDLKFIRANIQNLPRETYPELFKLIIERWTDESYTSFLQSWGIDYPC